MDLSQLTQTKNTCVIHSISRVKQATGLNLCVEHLMLTHQENKHGKLFSISLQKLFDQSTGLQGFYLGLGYILSASQGISVHMHSSGGYYPVLNQIKASR